MKILSFFLFFGVIFALLDPDPDPDPAAQINADPDPKPWLTCRGFHIFLSRYHLYFFLKIVSNMLLSEGHWALRLL
jgi:hypothetical protein